MRKVKDRKFMFSKSMHPFSYSVVYLFGIDLADSRLKKLFGYVIRYIMMTTWILAGLEIAVQFYDTPGQTILKQSSTAMLLVFNTFFLWCYLIKRKYKLASMLRKLQNLEKALKLSPPETLSKTCFVAMFLAYISVVFLALYRLDENSQEYLLNRVVIGTIKQLTVFRPITLVSVSFYIIMIYYQIFCFNGFMSVFYLVTCRRMQMILDKYIQMKKKALILPSRDEDSEFCLYSSILSTFQKVDAVLSFPIFLITSSSALALLMRTLDAVEKKNLLYRANGYLMLWPFIVFTMTSLAAAAVNEKDKMAKQLNLKSLRAELKFGPVRRVESFVTFTQMNSTPAFVLTGWGFFEITKMFYIAAMGTLITYSLLIINV